MKYNNAFNWILIFESEYYKGKRWNGKGYDANGNVVYELKDGKGYVKEYIERKLYSNVNMLMEIKMEKVKNMD